MGVETYQVVAPKGAVVEESGSALFYQSGAIFQAQASNPSIQRHLTAQAISRVVLDAIPSTPVVSVIAGPAGPQGLPGGPAGSLHSVKLRSAPLGYPFTFGDTGAVSIIAWTRSTETLYDEAGMFDRVTDPEKVFIKAGGAGRHHVVASVRFNVNSTGARYAEVNHYRSDDVLKDTAENSKSAVAGLDTIVPVAGYFNCADGDYFTLSYRQTSTSTILGAASFSAMLMGSGPAGPVGPAGADGSDGAVGPQGTQGPIGLNWRGIWISGATYLEGDAVVHLGSSFIALAMNLSDPPLSVNWLVIAAQGIQGLQGPAG